MAAPLERLNSPDNLGAHDPYALVGEIVSGRFRVLALKHAGPRAVIYEVEPPGVGQMRRALKVVTVAEAREPDVAERLRTVIRALRDADHPNLERVYDVALLPDESPFVVAEWLPQVTLERVLGGRRRLPTVTTLEIFLRIARGCAALHERGVVHGDVRPNHVLVEMAGEEPQDIRVVKVTDAGVPGVLNMGPMGGAAGQVAYMAPECLTGQARSPASDVYALGVLAYRMLTQMLPYRSEDPRASAQDRDPVSRVRWLHLHASPVRPSKLVGTADFSPDVEAVIGRAMAKSLGERFVDAGALVNALEAALEVPALRAPGAVAMPISEILDTEGTSPELAPGKPAPEAAVARSASLADEARVDAARIDLEANGGAAPSAPPVTLPSPRYWAWVLAGVATGALLALV
jgi:serine/threonine-protein kinase